MAMDKGPWGLFYGKRTDELLGLLSEDFEHDVFLEVNGDFVNPEQKKVYCEWLMAKLNSPSESQ
jgi:hypothetical protein